MPTRNDILKVHEQGWVLWIRPPVEPGPSSLFVLLHGWTGSEEVMWVFAHGFPKNAWTISLRGPVSANGGGYGWTGNHLGVQTPVDQFQPAAEDLHRFLDDWSLRQNIQDLPVNLVGFSQGAALAFTYSLIFPGKIQAVAGLAGFLPAGSQRYFERKPLQGKPVFVAHGSLDETVPLEYAERAVRGLKAAGAQVTYCIADVGHKLGASCLRSLNQFVSGL